MVTKENENKFFFIVYSKASGQPAAIPQFDYETEQQAMHAAVDFMRDGKDPGAQPPDSQPS